MNPLIERIVHIMNCMYHCDAEAVIETSADECYLFLGPPNGQITVSYEELGCLECNDIIELDGGSAEGFADGESERFVYRLTDMAKQRIEAILRDNKLIRIEEG